MVAFQTLVCDDSFYSIETICWNLEFGFNLEDFLLHFENFLKF